MRIILVRKHVKYVLLSKDISLYIQDGQLGWGRSKESKGTLYIQINQSTITGTQLVTLINKNICCVCSDFLSNFTVVWSCCKTELITLHSKCLDGKNFNHNNTVPNFITTIMLTNIKSVSRDTPNRCYLNFSFRTFRWKKIR